MTLVIRWHIWSYVDFEQWLDLIIIVDFFFCSGVMTDKKKKNIYIYIYIYIYIHIRTWKSEIYERISIVRIMCPLQIIILFLTNLNLRTSWRKDTDKSVTYQELHELRILTLQSKKCSAVTRNQYREHNLSIIILFVGHIKKWISHSVTFALNLFSSITTCLGRGFLEK